MADTQYKKGELLFNEDVTTVAGPGTNYAVGLSSTQLTLEQNVLLINFNEVEYVCEKMSSVYDSYGGVGTNGPDFSVYPFACYSNGLVYLFTESPGTYNLKIYTAIEDTDSDSFSEPITIRSYIDKNLTNLNWNILPQIFESEGVELTEEIKRYLKETPKNTNWNVFKDLKI